MKNLFDYLARHGVTWSASDKPYDRPQFTPQEFMMDYYKTRDEFQGNGDVSYGDFYLLMRGYGSPNQTAEFKKFLLNQMGISSPVGVGRAASEARLQLARQASPAFWDSFRSKFPAGCVAGRMDQSDLQALMHRAGQSPLVTGAYEATGLPSSFFPVAGEPLFVFQAGFLNRVLAHCEIADQNNAVTNAISAGSTTPASQAMGIIPTRGTFQNWTSDDGINGGETKREKARREKRERDEEKARQEREDFRNGFTEIEGTIVSNILAKLSRVSIDEGTHLLLVGEPGAGKTELARGLAKWTGRDLYHMEVSGLGDVTQLEAERFISVQDGASVTTYAPSQILKAIRAASRGERVLLVIDEIARVQDQQILNPLFLLLSQGEYHCSVDGTIYTVENANLVAVATANLDAEYNFSGNNRRGMDSALLDRFRILRMPRLSLENMVKVLSSRGVKHETLAGCLELWKVASQKSDDDRRQLVTTRAVFDIAKAHKAMRDYMSFSEVFAYLMTAKAPGSPTVAALLAHLEGKKI